MFGSTFLRIVKPSTLGPCQVGYFHFIPTKTQKNIGFNLLEYFFLNTLCKLGFYNLVLKHIIILS
jgi:hypothetical protein